MTPEVVEKVHFVFKNRYLIVKRRENLSESEEATLATMFAYQPGLKTLRTFMDKVFVLFSANQTRQQACRRRSSSPRRIISGNP